MARHREAAFADIADCDRLGAVFTSLEEAGILTAENAGSTMGDVRDGMWQALEQAQAAGTSPRGWVASRSAGSDAATGGDGCL